jgi:hypothetical protein
MNPYRIVVAVLLMLAAQTASAQDREHGSFVTDVVRAVVLDPTTYAPAFVAWEATRLDWRSSQVFFENGWRESNQRFTLSGRGNDVAVSYVAGNRTILMDALANLQLSAIHNVSERVIERVLLPRYPNHRTLIRTLGWIERSALASYWTYRLSAGHFRQWQENERLAREFGYR